MNKLCCEYDGALSSLVQGVPAHSRRVEPGHPWGPFQPERFPGSRAVFGGGKGGRARAPGQALTEHGVQAHEAADEAVEVDVHVLVGVAHGDDVVELVVEPKPCGEARTGLSWASGRESAAAP